MAMMGCGGKGAGSEDGKSWCEIDEGWGLEDRRGDSMEWGGVYLGGKGSDDGRCTNGLINP